jgi:probable rRNA maturation factor
LNPAARKRIRRKAVRILSASGSTEAEWSILLTDDDQQRELNATYRGQPRTTDVLSFSAADPHHPHILGDVVISVEQAVRQAPDGALEPEIFRLLAHGLCHLLGHDHERDDDARRMAEAEATLLGT